MDKSDIALKEIVADIRSGVGDVIIMEKYQISPSVLLKVKQSLAKLLSPDPMEKSRVQPKSGTLIKRKSPRHHVCYRIPVRDANNPQNVGTINDISKCGLQLQGIAARAGQTLSLLVLADSFQVHALFGFEAVCCWATREAEGESVAGFAIRKISGKDFQELCKLIRELTVAEDS